MIIDTEISIKRLTRDHDNDDKESYVANLALSEVRCQIQPASPEQTAIAEGIFAQTYLCFTTESGILTGDKIYRKDTGEELTVRGIENWSMPDVAPHYELTLVRMEEEEVGV
jgi:hypothetical protein